MNVPREQVSLALFNLIALAPQFFPVDFEYDDWESSSRTPRIWGDVAPADQPYYCTFADDENDAQDQAYGIENYLLDYTLLIYARADATPEPTLTGETIANYLIDAVDQTLQSQPIASKLFLRKGEPQTLGGLITNCWIEGRVIKDIGVLDQQIKIAIPLKIRTGL